MAYFDFDHLCKYIDERERKLAEQHEKMRSPG